tara:strand:+ start:1242 stop:1700 length:459 start_codon:yes stop_codon:yes gene_type:complete
MGGIKDSVKRDLVQWNDITQKIWFSVTRSQPSEIKEALMFDITTQKLAEVATLKDEKLIRASFEAMVDIVKRRKNLLEIIASTIGNKEEFSRIDLDWALRYGVEFFPESVTDCFEKERKEVFERMMDTGMRTRVKSIIDNVGEVNLDNPYET